MESDPTPQCEKLMREARQRVQTDAPILFLSCDKVSNTGIIYEMLQRTSFELADRFLAWTFEKGAIAHTRDHKDGEQIRRSIREAKQLPRKLSKHVDGALGSKLSGNANDGTHAQQP